MAENVYPKADNEQFYGSEANEALGVIAVTAGEAITAGNIVYVKISDGKAYISGTGATDTIRASGIALNNALITASVSVQTRGIYYTTGLTANIPYYLGAAGASSATASGVRIGTSISTTKLFINIVQDDRDVVGTIKSYVKSFTGLPSNNMTAFWKECDGSTLSDTESPLNGQVLPNLNVIKRFLRGSTTSGTTGGTDSITLSHGIDSTNQWDEQYPDSGVADHTFDPKPPYYEVVFIMKVK